MADMRKPLDIGTIIKFETGSRYRISGEPIGFGGGSIIYPAHKLIHSDDPDAHDGLEYALKECFPSSRIHHYIRKDDGQITAESGLAADAAYLSRARQMLLAESQITTEIYKTSSRLIPVRETSSSNAMTVMDSLTSKGTALRKYVRENGALSPLHTFQLTRQILFALKEVHDAGFLHLDMQDGNVFVQGSLDNESDFVSLIDFGAARKMHNGLTDEIKDRVIFTTEGFTAPEMIFENDGTLRLSPETDLYSIGCLMLYMLTGEKYAVDRLINTTDGKYLTRFKLRKIKCPSHLIDQMQAIIARALETDRSRRYHSADEMLADVTDFAKALSPYRSDLSEVAYDAFICYKHTPIDSQCALALQKYLERYKPPRGISNKKKPFKRVFLDEGEFSSCADFGEQINAALKKTGWLIVLCSKSTPSSPWVKKEIAAFLKYHDRSRILAVLTDGEPEEAFPEELLGNPDGSGQVLAADARGKHVHQIIRNLKKDPLLKIAAPMLGTTFDSLKQRQKLYTLRRTSCTAAAALLIISGFLTYAFIQSSRLNSEYEKNLISQSRYLGKSAKDKYEDKKPLEAIELALQALPDKETDRPLMADAEYALSNALNAYSIETDHDFIVTGSYSYRGSSLAEDFIADDENNVLFIENGTDVSTDRGLQIFDMSTRKLIDEVFFQNDSIKILDENLLLKEEKTLVYATYHKVVCYDYDHKDIVWTVDLGSSESVKRLALLPKRNEIACFTDGGSSQNNSKVYFINMTSGQIKSDIDLNIDHSNLEEGVTAVSNDEKTLVLDIHDDSKQPDPTAANYNMLVENETNDMLVLIDLDSKKIQVQQPQTGLIGNIVFDEEDNLFISGPEPSGMLQYMKAGNLLADDFSHTAFIVKYDYKNEKIIWQQNVTYSGSGAYSCINDLKRMHTNDQNYLIFSIFDKCLRIDESSGDILDSWELQAPIIWTETFNNGKGLKILTGDGMLNQVIYGVNRIDSQMTFDQSIKKISFYHDTALVLYETYQGRENLLLVAYQYSDNKNWTLLADDLDFKPSDMEQAAIWHEKMLILKKTDDADSSHKISCVLYSGEQGVRELNLDLDKSVNLYANQIQNWGVHTINGRDVFIISYRDTNNITNPWNLWCIDADTLEDQVIPVPNSNNASQDSIIIKGNFLYICQNQPLHDGDVHIICDENEMPVSESSLYKWNMSPDSEPEKINFHIPEDQNDVLSLIQIDEASGDLFLLYTKQISKSDKDSQIEYTLYHVDNKKTSVKKILNKTMSDQDAVDITITDNKQLLFIANEFTEVYDFNGHSRGKITYAPGKDRITGITMLPDDSILLITSSSYMLKYHLNHDEPVWKLDLEEVLGTSNSPYSKIDWGCIDDTHLYLMSDDYHHKCAVINYTDYGCGITGIINNCLAYDFEKDSFYKISDSNTKLGFLKRNSIEELVESGKAILDQQPAITSP